MKDKFKECMRFLFPYGRVPPTQIRDMVRVFSMGWVEGQGRLGVEPTVESLHIMSLMADPNWIPDDSWVWWQ